MSPTESDWADTNPGGFFSFSPKLICDLEKCVSFTHSLWGVVLANTRTLVVSNLSLLFCYSGGFLVFLLFLGCVLVRTIRIPG